MRRRAIASRSRQVRVRVRRTGVTRGGQVGSRAHPALVTHAVRGMPGVREVHGRLQLRG